MAEGVWGGGGLGEEEGATKGMATEDEETGGAGEGDAGLGCKVEEGGGAVGNGAGTKGRGAGGTA